MVFYQTKWKSCQKLTSSNTIQTWPLAIPLSVITAIDVRAELRSATNLVNRVVSLAIVFSISRVNVGIIFVYENTFHVTWRLKMIASRHLAYSFNWYKHTSLVLSFSLSQWCAAVFCLVILTYAILIVYNEPARTSMFYRSTLSFSNGICTNNYPQHSIGLAMGESQRDRSRRMDNISTRRSTIRIGWRSSSAGELCCFCQPARSQTHRGQFQQNDIASKHGLRCQWSCRRRRKEREGLQSGRWSIWLVECEHEQWWWSISTVHRGGRQWTGKETSQC